MIGAVLWFGLMYVIGLVFVYGSAFYAVIFTPEAILSLPWWMYPAIIFGGVCGFCSTYDDE